MEGALKQFEGDVQLVLYHFALNSRSEVATQAALCAGEQGKFWEFHRMLYRRQAQWNHLTNPLDQLLEFTNGMELDSAALKNCVKSGRMLKIIKADQDYGRSLQVNSTPTLFVNNQRIVAAQSEAELVRTIRRELTRARRTSS